MPSISQHCHMPPSLSEKKSSLDSAFPSILLMGLCLALAIVCIVICGWKIILLEEEQKEIARERLLLERDRDEFLTYGGELPGMRAEHQRLMEDIARERETRREITQAIGELEEAQRKLRLDSGVLSGAIATLEGQAASVRERLGADSQELERLGPGLEEARAQAARLAAEEKTLRGSIDAQRKTEAELTAAIAVLERRQASAREMLERVADDKEYFAGLQKRFDQQMEKFDGIVAKAGALTGDYEARLEDMARFKATLEQGMAVLGSDLKGFEASIETLRQDRAGQAALLKQGEEYARLLRGQIDDIAASNKKFSATMDGMSGLDQKLRAALAAQTAALARLTGDDERTRASLAAAAETLGRTAEALKSEQEKIQANAAQFASFLAIQKGEIDQLKAQAADLAEMAAKNHEAAQDGARSGARFAEAARNLQGQADALKERLAQAEAQTGQMRAFLDEQRTRQEELGRLARETREEIGKNRRQGLELLEILAELKELMPEHSMTQAEPASGAEGTEPAAPLDADDSGGRASRAKGAEAP